MRNNSSLISRVQSKQSPWFSWNGGTVGSKTPSLWNGKHTYKNVSAPVPHKIFWNYEQWTITLRLKEIWVTEVLISFSTIRAQFPPEYSILITTTSGYAAMLFCILFCKINTHCPTIIIGKEMQKMKSSNNMAMIQNILSLFFKFASLIILSRSLLIVHFCKKYFRRSDYITWDSSRTPFLNLHCSIISH